MNDHSHDRPGERPFPRSGGGSGGTAGTGATGNGVLRSAAIALVALLAIGIALGKPYVIGAAIVLVAYALHGVYMADRRGGAAQRSRAQRALVGVLLGCGATFALGAIAYATFAKLTSSACADAERARTRRARADAFAEVRSRGWFARRLGQEIFARCYADDPAHDRRGAFCPEWRLDEEPCDCSGTKWPDAAKCGDRRAYCGCLFEGAQCRDSLDCCSDSCSAGRCAGGYSSLQTTRLHCVDP